ncbi:MAG: ROK family protein [Rhodobacteraceae bacterium]|jgi:predicted NBD/HSP70 family sugar kinase|nr:ROK family protein [Paracoccaceae bacterium]
MTAVLAVDIGGTKVLAALVSGARVTARRTVDTARDGGPDAWTAALGDAARDWAGGWRGLGVAVTGAVAGGRWRALNPGTLDIPAGYPLADRVRALTGAVPVLANDAQAAAWGEYRHGAGAGRDMAFLTVSTGIGGGLVLGGRLVGGHTGVAGSFGQMTDGGDRVEDMASGRWIAAEAARRGHVLDARGVFAAAAAGAGWAAEVIAASADRVAHLCRNVLWAADPDVIVVGGGVGLAPGYLPRVRDAVDAVLPGAGARIVPAALGADAGVIGMAALVTDTDPTTKTRQEDLE